MTDAPSYVEFTEEELKTDPILWFFLGHRRSPTQQEIAEPFEQTAKALISTLPRNAERTVALRKLLESKDAAMRAAVKLTEIPE